MVNEKTSLNRPLYCGELAGMAGVSADTVRYYERHQLLPVAPRSSAGYRLFPREAFSRLQLIRAALSMGFSVSELAVIFRARSSGGAPCHRVRELAAEKLLELEARLRDLQSWRSELRKTLAHWDQLLAKTPRGKPACLLETLAAKHRKSQVRRAPLEFFSKSNQGREKRR